MFFGGTALLVLSGNPFPISPSGPPVDPGAVKAVVLLVYGIPVLISIWWLVLFNLKGTKAQFAGTSSETSPGIPSAPACPGPLRALLSFSFSPFYGCWSYRSCKCHFRPSFSGIRFTMRQLQLFWSLGLLFSILIIAILLFYRRRFMEAASARQALPPA